MTYDKVFFILAVCPSNFFGNILLKWQESVARAQKEHSNRKDTNVQMASGSHAIKKTLSGKFCQSIGLEYVSIEQKALQHVTNPPNVQENRKDTSVNVQPVVSDGSKRRKEISFTI